MITAASGFCLLAYAASTFANVLPSKSQSLEQRVRGLGKRDGCTNTATSRSCWSDGYDISTNWYDNIPNTGKTVTVRVSRV
jgi:hypothetical protein